MLSRMPLTADIQLPPTSLADMAVAMGVATWPSVLTGFQYVKVRDATTPGEQIFKRALDLLGGHMIAADLRRLDVADGLLQAALYVTVADDRALATAIESLRRELPGAVTVTFIDQESTGVSW